MKAFNSGQALIAIRRSASLKFGSEGTLFGIQHGRVVRIDLQTGATQAELPEIDGQQRIAHKRGNQSVPTTDSVDMKSTIHADLS